MVSDPAFEIVIRVLKHITGSREPGESGQKDESQHRTRRLLSPLVTQNGFRMQMGSVEAPLFSCAARGKPRMRVPQTRPSADWSIEKEKGMEAV